MILNDQLKYMSDQANQNSESIFIVVSDTIAFLDSVGQIIINHVYEKGNLLKITELIASLSIFSRKLPSLSVVLIQFNIKIFEKLSKNDDDTMIILLKTTYIAALLHKNILDENHQFELSCVENCLSHSTNCRKLLMDNYNLLKSANSLTLLDAPLKCVYIELQCITTFVNIGSKDKSLVCGILEELFFKGFEISNTIDRK